jgi:DNA-binding NtrC family response regulator
MTDESTLGRRSRPTLRAPRACLRVVHSPDAAAVGRTLDLDAAHTLGRQGPSGFADARMSREHARLLPRRGLAPAELEDLESNNGTWVNGTTVTRTPLRPNDVVAIGETLLVVDQESYDDRLPVADERAAGPAPQLEGLLGASYVAERLRRSLLTVAASRGPVLLFGETGTGKEVAARALHERGGRAGPWVALNCAAIPTEVAEAELFGHKKGAFTGALADRVGAFASAHGGTLFLDEVAELSPAMQAKLLRALELSEIVPVGSSTAEPVDVRVVAATLHAPESGKLRADLHARLAEWELVLPPLVERRADILLIFDHFSGGVRRTPELSEALLTYSWPQNVRELRNLARRVASLVGAGGMADLSHAPATIRQRMDERFGEGGPSLSRDSGAPMARDSAPPRASRPVDPESVGPGRAALDGALRETRGNLTLVAEKFGVHRQQLYRWLSRLGLDADDYR